MPSYRLTIEYDGTDFRGWQRNPGLRTVQGTVMEAVAEMAEDPDVVVQGASRTDSGVHALGQEGVFTVVKTNIEPAAWLKGINALMPPDVAVVRCALVADDWDPRRGAVGKHYRYTLLNRRIRSPLLERRTWWRRGRLDVQAMHDAGQELLGEHDFSSFRAASCTSHTPWRRMDSVRVAREGDVVHIDVQGNAFLQHMVRNIAGTLVEVGHGKRTPEQIGQVLAARDRTKAGRTAPAKGLTLVSVRYESDADPESGAGAAAGKG